MSNLLQELKETIDRPLESFLDNVDRAFTEQKDEDALAEKDDSYSGRELEEDEFVTIEK